MTYFVKKLMAAGPGMGSPLGDPSFGVPLADMPTPPAAIGFIVSLTLTVGAFCPLRTVYAQQVVPLVTAVESVGMTVEDMDRSVAFYRDVLTFRKVSDVEVAGEDYERLQGIFGLRLRIVRLKLGEETITLTEYLTPKGRPVPADSRSNDRWFQHIAIIVSDMDRAYARLSKHNVRHVSTAPQRLPDQNPNAGGIEAFYFHDPDGHVLEILHFPKGKGNPKWHRKTDKLFLGIDHTAIVVSDTEASLAFYRDRLGFAIAGTSDNYGTEQEHLNNVPGAHLRITSLKTSSGPAIEFLEYLSPRDGRPRPSDAKSNDLLHWQTRLVAQDIQAFPSAGFERGALVADPDGHVMELIKR